MIVYNLMEYLVDSFNRIKLHQMKTNTESTVYEQPDFLSDWLENCEWLNPEL